MPDVSNPGLAIKQNGTLILGGAFCLDFQGISVTLDAGNAIRFDFGTVLKDTDLCYQTANKTGNGEASKNIKLITGDIKVGEPVGNIGKIQLITGDNDGTGDGRGTIEMDCNVIEFFNVISIGPTAFEISLLRGLNDVTGLARGAGFRQSLTNPFGIRTDDDFGNAAGVGDIWLHTGKPTAGRDPGDIEFRTGDAVAGNTNTGNIVFIIGTPSGAGTKGRMKFNQIITDDVVWQNDTTANRPGSPQRGQRYFDITLGIPIWYDGTSWVDATGSAV